MKPSVRSTFPDTESREHLSFIQETTEILAGRRSLAEDKEYVYVYKAPHPTSIAYDPRLRQTPFGYILVDDYQRIKVKKGAHTKELHTIASHAPSAIEYLSDLMGLVQSERQKAVQKGLSHIVSEYDNLLQYIRHEYFFHRARLREADADPGRAATPY
ncbi:MAG: hypothetical protein D6698_01590 [Gammaproteobacteria bacterium]|nr:MAG: hypothetical protein D6698_01590 [Gammaproteobacteria bacterium]